MLTQVSVSVKVLILTVAAVQVVSETKLRSSYNFFLRLFDGNFKLERRSKRLPGGGGGMVGGAYGVKRAPASKDPMTGPGGIICNRKKNVSITKLQIIGRFYGIN
jgi:hypothetical protein